MGDNSDSEDDQELLVAAAGWAESGDGDIQKSKSKESLNDEDVKPKQSKASYSLHITQLSYDATDFDVRDLFITKGCLVTSVRLVYEGRGSDRLFKGVAFVDVSDQRSFEIALKCHRMTHLGRRINVRPVLSKHELGRIAEATKEKVSEIINASTEDKLPDKNNKTKVKPKKSETKKSPHKRKGSSKLNIETGETRKLTKKERNRKAAILMQKKKARAKK